MKKLNKFLAGIMSILIAAANTGIYTSAAEKEILDYKDETVYIVADQYGAASDIIVSDWLKNNSKSDSIKDCSELQNIENVKGNEQFTQNGSDVSWSASGEDIYYKGASSKELPVTVKVTYYLDDKEISPDQLAGKSGKVRIRYDYTNNSKKTVKINNSNQTIYSPFVMISAVILDSQKFQNVEVTNGKTISDGDKIFVAGTALPGISESLKTVNKDSDFDIPDYFEFTAEVNDFSLGTSFTVAYNEIFSELDLDDIGNTEELDKKIKELKDSVNKLTDGTKKLYDGTKKLSDGSDSLIAGIDALSIGSEKLCSGTFELYNGASQLTDGAQSLYYGTFTLSEAISEAKAGSSAVSSGSKELAKGFKPIMDGADTLTSGTSDILTGTIKLQNGAEALTDGTEKLLDGSGTLSESASMLSDGISEAKSGFDSIKSGIESVDNGAGQLSDGANQLESGASSLCAGIDQAGASLDTTIEYNKQVLDGLKLIYEQSPSDSIYTLITTLEQTIAGQEEISNSMKDGGQLKDGASAVESGAASLGEGIDNLKQGTASLSSGADELSDGLNALNDGGIQLSNGVNILYNSVNDLYDGAGSLFEGTGSLAYANKAVKDGAEKLSKGLKSASEGADKLSSGAETLDNGLSSILDGSNTLVTGAETLYKSIESLKTGSESLYDGTIELSNGITTLDSGSDELIKGVKQLESGSKELNDGMNKFKKDAVDKITDAYENDIKALLDILKELSDAAKDYNNYSGINDNMNGNVKFIYTIEGIESEN